jgi:(p)ppGpp synthase/HD superfamily hydrolase
VADIPVTPVLDTPEALSFWVAADLASEAHAGQLDKAGEPYFFHVFRVGVSLLPNWAAARVGVCHDILEDCPNIAARKVLAVMQSKEEERALQLLYRRRDQDYKEYVHALAADPLARLVKMADLEDNLRPDRTAAAEAAGANITKLAHRYMWALYFLRTGKGPKPGCSDCDEYGCTMNCGPAVPPEPCGR